MGQENERRIDPSRTRRVAVIRHNKDKFWVVREVLGMGHFDVLSEHLSLEQAQSVEALFERTDKSHIVVRDSEKAWFICYKTDWHYAVQGKCRTQFGADHVLEKILGRISRQ